MKASLGASLGAHEKAAEAKHRRRRIRRAKKRHEEQALKAGSSGGGDKAGSILGVRKWRERWASAAEAAAASRRRGIGWRSLGGGDIVGAENGA